MGIFLGWAPWRKTSQAHRQSPAQGLNLEHPESRWVPSFIASRSFDTGPGPIAALTQDFNGDGFPDLVVTDHGHAPYYLDGGVSLLLGNGDGTFQSPRTLAAGGSFGWLEMADFNGDGITDLAVTNPGTNYLTVLLGNGNRTFQSSTVFFSPAIRTTLPIAVGDFNGDGIPDIATIVNPPVSQSQLIRTCSQHRYAIRCNRDFGRATVIYLTDDQRQALRQTGDRVPLPVYDPQTDRMYVLLPSALYDRVRAHLEAPTVEENAEIPPGIRRSKEAFLRDLPELLKNRKLKGRWVIYHGDKRIGIHWKPEQLIRECNQRGLTPADYYLGTIEEHEPEPVELERSPAGFDWEEDCEAAPPSTPPNRGDNAVPT